MTAYQRLVEEIMQVFGVGEFLMQLAIVGTARVLVSPLLASFGLTGDLNFDIITLCIRVVPLREASHFGFSEKKLGFFQPPGRRCLLQSQTFGSVHKCDEIHHINVGGVISHQLL